MTRKGSIWPWVWGLLGIGLVLRTGLRDRGVISDHLEFGRRLLTGHDLYAPYLEPGEPLHPPYPPSFGLLTAPFALLPERIARIAWGALQVAALRTIALRLRIFVPHEWQSRIHWIYLFAAVLGARYILRDTHGGGGNLINLALVLLALHDAASGREVRGGIILGFSIATKPTAILMLPFLFVLGHKRAMNATILSGAAFLGVALLALRQGVAPFLIWFDGSIRYAAMTDLFADPAAGFPDFTWMNQCLRCAITRYFGLVPDVHAARVPGFFNGLGWPPSSCVWITRILAGGLLASVATVVWRRRYVAAARPWLIASMFALSLLLSPISWKAHHTALLPAFFMLGICALTDYARRPRWAWVLAGTYFAACVLGEEIVGKGFKNVQQSLYLTTVGTLACLAFCLWQALRATCPEPHRPSLP